MSDIEGKAASVAASEFQLRRKNLVISVFAERSDDVIEEKAVLLRRPELLRRHKRIVQRR